jgi:hypothetical protein
MAMLLFMLLRGGIVGIMDRVLVRRVPVPVPVRVPVLVGAIPRFRIPLLQPQGRGLLPVLGQRVLQDVFRGLFSVRRMEIVGLCALVTYTLP